MYELGSKIFINCDLYLGTCCCFVKHSFRPAIFVLTASVQREKRNNAASLNLIMLHSLSIGLLFRSAFAVYVAGATKLFLLIVSETISLALKSRLSTNSLYCCWNTSSIESTDACSFSLYGISDPVLITESSKNRLIGKNLPTTVV